VARADAAVKKVKCDTGQTLTEALQKAKPGDTLQVKGTCAGTGSLATISASDNRGNGIAIGLDGAVVSPFGPRSS
jgi:hypothetical protein